MTLFGIDIGGTGIKGAPVNLETGELQQERFRVETPRPAKPEPMALAVKQVLDQFNWTGPVGVGFPTIVQNGLCKSQSNLHPEWLNVHIDQLFKEVCGNDFKIINDADAAGLAEVKFGAGKGEQGLVITITLGTGIGSGLFYNGELIPNIELGHLRYKKNKPVEKFAADSIRKKLGLTDKEYAERLDYYLQYVDRVCSPDLIIIGGGGSKLWETIEPLLTTDVRIKVAETKNEAGIIGAALASQSLHTQ